MTEPRNKAAKSKRSRARLGFRFGLTGLVIVAALAVAYAAWYLPALRPVNPATRRTVLLHVVRGESAKSLYADLKAKGLIRSENAAWFFGEVSGRGRKLKAGYYDVSAAMSAPELITAVSEGRVARRKIMVVPGLRLEQVAGRVERAGLSDRATFLAAARADAFVGEVRMPLPRGQSLEGYLYPATYVFAVGTPVHDIILAMLKGFDREFVAPNAASIRKSRLGLRKIVILASMIEREAKADHERPIIAGVVMNRLRQNMKLQIDATVIYALGHHTKRVTARDLAVNSPYNTYLYPGLPPGPICCPGPASLEAALHPAATPYLFYVADGRGTHVFSRTLAEHSAAIARVRGGGR